jgi:hypothetical protein
MKPDRKPPRAHRPLERLIWSDISEPGAYVEIATGTLYRVPQGGATPLVEQDGIGGSKPVLADALPPRHSQFVKVSRDPFIFSLGARLICVDHDIRPHF